MSEPNTELLSTVIRRYVERHFDSNDIISFKTNEILDILEASNEGVELLHLRHHFRALMNQIILKYKPLTDELHVIRKALNTLDIADFLHSNKVSVAIDGTRISWYTRDEKITTESGVSSSASSILNTLK